MPGTSSQGEPETRCSMKSVGVLTGGGDAPGLNAVIRAVVKTAHDEYGCEILGIKNGFNGLLDQCPALANECINASRMCRKQ